jgi:Alkylmercury lyase
VNSVATETVDHLGVRLARLGLPASGVRGRQAGLPEPLRALHRRLLGAFLAHGGPPDPAAVAGMAADVGLEPRQALAALAAADVVHTDPASGTINVAYPFSGRPTSHRVRLAGGPTVHAMCALDALGIPQMTGRDALIGSTDPGSGQQITVELRRGAWRWRPATAVVLVATAAHGACVADCCCPWINFHTDPDHAQAYLKAHPGMTGELLGQAAAVQAAGRVFRRLLDPNTSR